MQILKICQNILAINDDLTNNQNNDFDNSNGVRILQDFDSWYERSWNSCELKVFDNENFRGKQTRIQRQKKRIRRGRTKYSLQNLGRCCWKIYSRGKFWKVLRPNKEIKSMRKSLKTPFYVMRIPCST